MSFKYQCAAEARAFRILGFAKICGICLPPSTQESQEHEEEIDEVEVKSERPEDGRLAPAPPPGKRLDLLSVIGGKPSEDDDPHSRDNPGNRIAVHEDVDYRGDHHTDEPHEEKAPPRSEVAACHVAIGAHGAEHSGSDDEGGSDGVGGVDKEDDGKGDAVQCRVGDEQHRRNRGAKPADSGRQGDNQSEFAEHKPIKNEPVPHHGIEERRRGDGDERQQGGNEKSCSHPGVNLPHEGALVGDDLVVGAGVVDLVIIHW